MINPNVHSQAFKEFLTCFQPLVEKKKGPITEDVSESFPEKRTLYVFQNKTEYSRYYIILNRDDILSSGFSSIYPSLKLANKLGRYSHALLSFSLCIIYPVYLFFLTEKESQLKAIRSESYKIKEVPLLTNDGQYLGMELARNEYLIRRTLSSTKYEESL